MENFIKCYISVSVPQIVNAITNKLVQLWRYKEIEFGKLYVINYRKLKFSYACTTMLFKNRNYKRMDV